jgi:hypothetical protein
MLLLEAGGPACKGTIGAGALDGEDDGKWGRRLPFSRNNLRIPGADSGFEMRKLNWSLVRDSTPGSSTQSGISGWDRGLEAFFLPLGGIADSIGQ